MVTRWRQRCLGEKLGCDAELRKERTMQRALYNDRDLRALANCTMRSGCDALAAASAKARPKPIR